MLKEAELPKTREPIKMAETVNTRQLWNVPVNKGSMISSFNKIDKSAQENWFSILSNGDINPIKDSLIDLKIPVSIKDSEGNTAIHIILSSQSALLNSELNCLEIINVLIDSNCPINIPNSYGQTPLHLATIKQFPNVVDLLIKNNCKTNVKDSSGKTPLDYAVSGVKKQYVREFTQPQMSSALFIVKRLLYDSYNLFINYINDSHIFTFDELIGGADDESNKKTKSKYLIQIYHNLSYVKGTIVDIDELFKDVKFDTIKINKLHKIDYKEDINKVVELFKTLFEKVETIIKKDTNLIKDLNTFMESCLLNNIHGEILKDLRNNGELYKELTRELKGYTSPSKELLDEWEKKIDAKFLTGGLKTGDIEKEFNYNKTDIKNFKKMPSLRWWIDKYLIPYYGGAYLDEGINFDDISDNKITTNLKTDDDSNPYEELNFDDNNKDSKIKKIIKSIFEKTPTIGSSFNITRPFGPNITFFKDITANKNSYNLSFKPSTIKKLLNNNGDIYYRTYNKDTLKIKKKIDLLDEDWGDFKSYKLKYFYKFWTNRTECTWDNSRNGVKPNIDEYKHGLPFVKDYTGDIYRDNATDQKISPQESHKRTIMLAGTYNAYKGSQYLNYIFDTIKNNLANNFKPETGKIYKLFKKYIEAGITKTLLQYFTTKENLDNSEKEKYEDELRSYLSREYQELLNIYKPPMNNKVNGSNTGSNTDYGCMGTSLDNIKNNIDFDTNNIEFSDINNLITISDKEVFSDLIRNLFNNIKNITAINEFIPQLKDIYWKIFENPMNHTYQAFYDAIINNENEEYQKIIYGKEYEIDNYYSNNNTHYKLCHYLALMIKKTAIFYKDNNLIQLHKENSDVPEKNQLRGDQKIIEYTDINLNTKDKEKHKTIFTSAQISIEEDGNQLTTINKLLKDQIDNSSKQYNKSIRDILSDKILIKGIENIQEQLVALISNNQNGGANVGDNESIKKNILATLLLLVSIGIIRIPSDELSSNNKLTDILENKDKDKDIKSLKTTLQNTNTSKYKIKNIINVIDKYDPLDSDENKLKSIFIRFFNFNEEEINKITYLEIKTSIIDSLLKKYTNTNNYLLDNCESCFYNIVRTSNNKLLKHIIDNHSTIRINTKKTNINNINILELSKKIATQALELLLPKNNVDKINKILTDIDVTSKDYKLYNKILCEIDTKLFEKLFKKNFNSENNNLNKLCDKIDSLDNLDNNIFEENYFNIIKVILLYPDYNFEYSKQWNILMNILQRDNCVGMIKEWAFKQFILIIKDNNVCKIKFKDSDMDIFKNNLKEQLFIIEKTLIQIHFFNNIELESVLKQIEEATDTLFDKKKFKYLSESFDVGCDIGCDIGCETDPDNINDLFCKLKDIWKDVLYPNMKKYYEIVLPKCRKLIFNIIDNYYNFKRAFSIYYTLTNYNPNNNFNDKMYIDEQIKEQKDRYKQIAELQETRMNNYIPCINNISRKIPYFRKLKQDYNNGILNGTIPKGNTLCDVVNEIDPLLKNYLNVSDIPD